YLTGATSSLDFPTRRGAFQPEFGGGFSDAFVAKVDPAAAGASFLIYSSFLGGDGDDEAHGIGIDIAGNAYVAGGTSTNGFPISAGAVQSDWAGGFEGFVAKIVSSGDLSVSKSGSPDPVQLGNN